MRTHFLPIHEQIEVVLKLFLAEIHNENQLESQLKGIVLLKTFKRSFKF